MRFLMVSLIALMVFLAGCAAYQSTGTGQASETGVKATGVKHEIDITSSGFSPRLSGVKLGDTLVFVNKDTSPHWPASDIHPTHSAYPEKGGCIDSKFDACKELKQNGKYEFTFFQSGSWCFHDHLNPSVTGCVDVQ
ncbi:MAG: hypothetical protein HYS80_01195 [Candidatus Aenigmarchaeota archaeon]|nr:hypothetical protein [Candidatus Aenigmarchaeota archaeon]